jgi:hypothetical protein
MGIFAWGRCCKRGKGEAFSYLHVELGCFSSSVVALIQKESIEMWRREKPGDVEEEENWSMFCSV